MPYTDNNNNNNNNHKSHNNNNNTHFHNYRNPSLYSEEWNVWHKIIKWGRKSLNQVEVGPLLEGLENKSFLLNI